jgi:hypothetical protein
MFRTLVFSIWLLFHPVHVTFTSIDYMPASDLFRVFVRFYFDDFLRDYKLSDGTFQSKDFSDTSLVSKNAIQRYIDEKVIIKVNEKQISGKLHDMKLIDNEISMNFEYKYWKKPKIITVKNLIMTGLYNDMSNMIIVKINDFEEGVRMTPELNEKTFIIK